MTLLAQNVAHAPQAFGTRQADGKGLKMQNAPLPLPKEAVRRGAKFSSSPV